MAFDPPSGAPGPTGLSEDEHWAYTLRKLGYGIIEIELTDEHKQDCLDDTKRWYAARVGFKTYIQLQLVSGMSDYILDPSTIDVYRVWLPSLAFTSWDTDPFGFTYAASLFSPWGRQTPMPISDIVQRLQYLSMIGRVLSVDRDWEWFPEQRRLSITKAPVFSTPSVELGGIASGLAILEAGSSDVDTRLLDPQHSDFFRRKLLIEAKRTLGNIRTIYDSFSTVGGERTMNGGALLQQAEQEDLKLNTDTQNWEPYVGMIIG